MSDTRQGEVKRFNRGHVSVWEAFEDIGAECFVAGHDEIVIHLSPGALHRIIGAVSKWPCTVVEMVPDPDDMGGRSVRVTTPVIVTYLVASRNAPGSATVYDRSGTRLAECELSL